MMSLNRKIGKIQMADELEDAVEKLIDDYGLLSVMDSAAEVCRLKAAHIRENWQDKELTKRWLKAAKKIEGMRAVLAAVPSGPAQPTSTSPTIPPEEATTP